MKISELRSKNEKELNKVLVDKVKEIEDMVSQVLSGKSKNTSAIKFLRKDAARIKTVLKEKEVLSSTESKDAKEEN